MKQTCFASKRAELKNLCLSHTKHAFNEAGYMCAVSSTVTGHAGECPAGSYSQKPRRWFVKYDRLIIKDKVRVRVRIRRSLRVRVRVRSMPDS